MLTTVQPLIYLNHLRHNIGAYILDRQPSLLHSMPITTRNVKHRPHVELAQQTGELFTNFRRLRQIRPPS